MQHRCVYVSASDRLTKHSQPEGAQRACNTWEGEVLRLLHMRRLSEHLKFGAMLRDGDGEREMGAPRQGQGKWRRSQTYITHRASGSV